MPNFDYEGAKKAGYSDEEITQYLSESNPKFDVKAAIDSGYSLEEVNKYLSSHEPKEERSFADKAARVATQFGVGVAQGSPVGLVYEAAVAPLASKEAQNVTYREGLSDELEQLLEKKATGEWNENDQKFLDNIIEQIKDPRKSMENVETADLGLRSLIEKSTGLDLKPEGVAEKAAQWAGFIKDPKKLFELGKTGIKSTELIKAIAPSGKEALRGLGAGVALEMAEAGKLGPMGTMAAAVLGDISGNLLLSGGKAVKSILTNPRKAIAEVSAKFTKKDQIELQKDIIKDFRDSNIQADIGTITDNDLMKWIQSRLAQSGLTGKGLDELKTTVTNQVKEEYKALADALGEARYMTSHEAGEVLKESIKTIRDADLAESRKLYNAATDKLNESAFVNPEKLAKEIEAVKKSLKPGNLKSPEQSSVLEILNTIERDIYDSEGNIIFAKVKDLMNDKIALNDIINYEIQGGSKQLLKKIVGELDRAIISHGKENPGFAKNFIKANRNFSQHAKTFRNKNISQLLKTHDPAQLMNKMNSIQGIQDIRSILNKTPEGASIFNSLARLKLDQVIGNNLVDSTTQQIKLGTFSKLLEKGKNRDVIKELLPAQSFKRLKRLQGNAGRLADTAQKFFNASKSGVTLEDAGVVAKVLTDLGHLLTGNPWPLVKTGATVAGARYLTKLIADPEFLKMVEEIVLATESNNTPLMIELGLKLVEIVKAAGIFEANQGSAQQRK